MNHTSHLSDKLLKSAFEAQASDIHFYPNATKAHIYFRIYGERILHQVIPMSQYELLLTYFKFSSSMDIGELRKPQNGSMLLKHSGINYSLRLSTLPHKDFETLAIRILSDQEISLDNLFLFKSQLNTLKSSITMKQGLFLTTGPTGSGKSTTLYALIASLTKNKALQVITLEDPVEKKLEHVIQIQINKKAGITYKSGLKAILRHDPDIIIIGEIRDAETARFAFEAALTGHLVFSTLHAKDTHGTIHRLLDFGLSKVEIEQSLIAIAATELLPILAKNTVQRRAAILELLVGQHLKNVIHNNPNSLHTVKTFHDLRKKAYAYGFISEENILFSP